MKLKLLLAIFFLSITCVFSQGINYKALIKDGGGNVISNDLIVVQFTILQGVTETNVYQEIHTPTTDINGIIIVNIGEGVVDSGVFSSLDWDSDDHFLNVQINTGSGLTDMGTTQFMAVPYALSAANAATKIDELSDGKSDSDGTEDGSSIFIGVNAGLNDDGTDNQNVGLGFEALLNNTTGNSNTASGYRALQNNTEGNNNTANGYESMRDNTIGINNTANGLQALRSNLTGSFNTANGFMALRRNTIGIENTANGVNTLFFNNEGSKNTAIGTSALLSNTTGSENTAIGSSSLINNTTGNNNIGIGNDAQVPNDTGDNQIRIGNTAIAFAGVQVPWTITSDKRWKDNIRELPYGLKVVKQLKPVDYVRKNNDAKTREMGFIAQDVEELLNKIGYKDQGFLTKDDKGYISLRYNDIIALLTKAIQEQQEIIDNQDNKINILTKELSALKSLESRVKQLEALLNTAQQ